MPLVAFEGLDGAGKTTVRGRLLRELSIAELIGGVIGTGEFESPIGSVILETLSSLTAIEKILLFAADRAMTLAKTGNPAQRLVLWDRYVASAFAYRWAEIRAAGEDVDASVLMPFVRQVNQRFPVPDLCIYLDIDVATAKRRKPLSDVQASVLEYVRAGYERYFTNARVPWSSVDATEDIETVVGRCVELMQNYGIIS